MTTPILETEDLVKRFGELTANDEISLGIPTGEIRGIIGPNGSGKTTFFNVVSGFYSATSGRVSFKGEDITNHKTHEIARRGLGRTFQITSPFENMTVKQNLLAVQTDEDNKETRADEILEFLDIDHIADHDAHGMSGGQHKLLELGRVMMLDPDCVLLDEPTAGINPVLADQIMTHIQKLNENGTTFVLVEHDMGIMRSVADTVSVFSQGRHLITDSFDTVTEDKRVQEAYLGTEAVEGST